MDVGMVLVASAWVPFNVQANDNEGASVTTTQQVTPAARASAAANTVSPSYFEADKDGVLWFRQGTDGEGAYTKALSRSSQNENIVILVATNEAFKDKATERGKKLQAWLQQHPKGPLSDGKSVELAITVDREAGTVYYYNVIDMPYWNDQQGIKDHPHAFDARAAAAVLVDVVADYIAAKELKAEKRAAEQANNQPNSANTVATTVPVPY